MSCAPLPRASCVSRWTAITRNTPISTGLTWSGTSKRPPNFPCSPRPGGTRWWAAWPIEVTSNRGWPPITPPICEAKASMFRSAAHKPIRPWAGSRIRRSTPFSSTRGPNWPKSSFTNSPINGCSLPATPILTRLSRRRWARRALAAGSRPAVACRSRSVTSPASSTPASSSAW